MSVGGCWPTCSLRTTALQERTVGTGSFSKGVAIAGIGSAVSTISSGERRSEGTRKLQLPAPVLHWQTANAWYGSKSAQSFRRGASAYGYTAAIRLTSGTCQERSSECAFRNDWTWPQMDLPDCLR